MDTVITKVIRSQTKYLTLTHPRGPFFGTSVKLADVRQSNQRSLVSGYRQLLASQSDWLKPVTYESGVRKPVS